MSEKRLNQSSCPTVAAFDGQLTLATFTEPALWLDPAAEPILLVGKPLAFLCYLACDPERRVGRDELATLLWGDRDQTAADHGVRQAIWTIRKRFSQHGVDRDVLRGHRVLQLGTAVHTDRDRFLEAIREGRHADAIDLYGGDFFLGFSHRGAARFEHWADMERARLRHLYCAAVHRLAKSYLSRGRARTALEITCEACRRAESEESLWRLRLECAIAAGENLDATTAAITLERRLRDEDREPDPTLSDLLARARATPKTEPAGHRLMAEMVGRERDFSSLLKTWRRTTGGRGDAIAVTGDAGVGKTRFVEDFCGRLWAEGAACVLVRANPGDRSIPWSLAGDLAEAVSLLPGAIGVSRHSAEILVDLHPPLSGPFANTRARRGDAAGRRVALAELLRAAADNGPFALVVDDAHWADEESRAVLEYAIPRLGESPVLCIVTTRSGASAPGLRPENGLRLRPLSAANVEELLGSIARLPDAPWAARFAETLHECTGGSPLLVFESLHLATERGVLEWQDGHWDCADPDALFAELTASGGATGRRIRSLDSESARLALLVATSRRPVELALLARAADRTPDAVRTRLDQLEVLGFVRREHDGWVCGHETVGDAIWSNTDAATRQSAHRALGRALAVVDSPTHAEWQRASRHLLAAQDYESVRSLAVRWIRRRDKILTATRPAIAELLGHDKAPQDIDQVVAGLPPGIRWRRPMAGTVAAGLVGSLVFFSSQAEVERPRPDAHAVITVAGSRASGVRHDVVLPMVRAEWDEHDVLDLSALGQRFDGPAAWTELRTSPGAAVRSGPWIYAKADPHGGGHDLFLMFAGEPARRLTHHRADDVMPQFSPDGKLVAFLTTRWTRGQYDLAIMTLQAETVRRLSPPGGAVMRPAWSPDGTRIAYGRAGVGGRPGAACHVDIAGTTERCLPLESPDVITIGWRDAESLFLGTPTETGTRIETLTLATGNVRPWMEVEGASTLLTDDSGRWIAYRRRALDAAPGDWWIAPIDPPLRPRRIIVPSEASSSATLTWVASIPPPHADTIVIATGDREFPVGIPLRLAATARDSRGRNTALGFVRWRIEDHPNATIDSSGVVLATAPGRARVTADAGGWRSATDTIHFVSSDAGPVLNEDWSAGFTARWRLFGLPRPTIDRRADRYWFRNNGDDNFPSGAYTTKGFSPRYGLGVEATVSAQARDPYQQVTLAFFGNNDSTWYDEWDHVSAIPLEAVSTHRCHVTLPFGSARQSPIRAALGLPGHTILFALAENVLDGRPFRLRLQMFPDGSCGAAVDGLPMIRSSPAVGLEYPMNLFVQGRSLETDVLVGNLEVWEGVRTDIAWPAPGFPK